MTATIERIPTGLTANYVSYWTVRQALKEAAQNIAYGAVKSGIPARLTWANGFGEMEDYHTGFEKRHLYLGESEQRDDKDGLGNFGEGWKVFLLVMARQGLVHGVETVGFTFWGEMTDTPHGTKVLTIVVEPNNRTVGTKVLAQCDEADFRAAVSSFAALQGIDCSEPGVIPGRMGELWVNGVRIEQGDNMNPLNLHFAYNLKDRSLLNRDRSQVNVSQTMTQVRELATLQPKEFVQEFVNLALAGSTRDDIQKGPYFTTDGGTYQIWRDAICEAHRAKFEKLVLSSNDADIDKEAMYRGFKILRTPFGWAQELRYIGFKKADEVVKIRPSYVEVKDLWTSQAENLKRAKADTKKALGLKSVKELPKIKVVESISGDGYGNIYGTWSPDEQTIYIKAEALFDLPKTVQILVHEGVHWQTGEGDNQPGFTRGFERAILRLLGHDPSDI